MRQITEQGYPVAEVSQRLGVSPHSLYEWKKTFSLASGNQGSDQSEEIRQLKKELALVGADLNLCRCLASAIYPLDQARPLAA